MGGIVSGRATTARQAHTNGAAAQTWEGAVFTR